MPLSSLFPSLRKGAAPQSKEIVYQLDGRASFIAFFSTLAEALTPEQINNVLTIYIAGGHASGKSLAADAFFKTLGDTYDIADLYNEQAKDKFFWEDKSCGASLSPLIREILVDDKDTYCMFQSAVGCDPDGLRRAFTAYAKKAGNARGVIFLTGFSQSSPFISGEEKNDVLSPKIYINIGAERFSQNASRTVSMTLTEQSLQGCPHFANTMQRMRDFERPKTHAKGRVFSRSG